MLEIKKVLTLGLMGMTTLAMACGGDDDNEGDGDGCGGHDICFPDASTDTPDANPEDNRIIRTGTLRDLVPAEHPAIDGNDVTFTIDPDNEEVYVDAFTSGGWEENEVVTVWWVHFHEVDQCGKSGDNGDEGGVDNTIFSLCSVPDLLKPHPDVVVKPAFGYAGPCPDGGDTADANGEVSFPKLVSPLVAADAEQNPDWLLGSNGLRDLNAETHIVLRSHGPALTGDDLNAQLCTSTGGYGAGEPNEGCTNKDNFPTNFCGNRQVVVFNPPT